MIEMAIIAMIVSSVTLRVAGNVAVDGFFAARGMESPRLAGARKRRPRGAASRYWSEVWADAWTGASAKRAARRANPGSPARPRGAATSFWAGWLQDQRQAARRRWNEGWTGLDEKRREKASRPRPGQVTVPGTVVPNAEDRPEPRPVPTEDDMPVRPADHDEPTEPIQQDGDQSVPDYVPDYVPDFGPDNDVTPPATPTTEGPTMTTTMPTDTEVVSLNKAIHYSESTARVATEMIYSIDTSQSNLAAGGVTGIAIESFASAKESFGTIAAAMERAAAEFKDHLAIQEARIANPGAGSDEFIMADR
jgi:hypothetical protein